MPIEVFEPRTLGPSFNEGTLFGGGTKVGAVTDNSDGTYVWVDRQGGTNQQTWLVTNPKDRASSIDANPDIDMRVQHDQPGPFTGSAQPGWRLNSVNILGLQTANLTNFNWLDFNSGPIARPGGGNWEPSDLLDVELYQVAGLGSTGTQVRFSKLSYNLNFSLTPAAFLLMMSCWIPPLMAVASHGLIKREIDVFFRYFKARPSNAQEYEAVARQLLVRPRFVC